MSKTQVPVPFDDADQLPCGPEPSSHPSPRHCWRGGGPGGAGLFFFSLPFPTVLFVCCWLYRIVFHHRVRYRRELHDTYIQTLKGWGGRKEAGGHHSSRTLATSTPPQLPSLVSHFFFYSFCLLRASLDPSRPWSSTKFLPSLITIATASCPARYRNSYQLSSGPSGPLPSICPSTRPLSPGWLGAVRCAKRWLNANRNVTRRGVPGWGGRPRLPMGSSAMGESWSWM